MHQDQYQEKGCGMFLFRLFMGQSKERGEYGGSYNMVLF